MLGIAGPVCSKTTFSDIGVASWQEYTAAYVTSAAAYIYVYMGSWDSHDYQFDSVCICQSHLLPIYMARSDLTDDLYKCLADY